MNHCPTCHIPVNSIKSVIRKNQILTGCDNCLNSQASQGQNDIARHKRQADYRDHAQDIVQPMEGHDYIKARGIDRAREMGYSDEDIRQLY